jgi:hypothetical protein
MALSGNVLFLDENGNRLKDAEGNLKTLRHKFAVYCDDICAGADTIEELYELFEALICVKILVLYLFRMDL